MTDRPGLAELLDHDRFRTRHLGLSAADRQVMLATVGAGSMAELLDRVVPAGIRLHESLDLPAAPPADETPADPIAAASWTDGANPAAPPSRFDHVRIVRGINH